VQRYLELIGRPDLPPTAAAALARQGIGERLALLDQTGIDIQVLSVSQAQPYLPDAHRAAEAAKACNDLYAELCLAHPGRFLAFAALPLPHIDQWLTEIARVAALPSAVGFTMGCSVAGHQLDDPVLDPVLAELDRRGAVVFLHPVGQDNTAWLSGHNLAWLVGAPFEDTAAALRLVLAAVPDRYPNLRFIVPHLGGTIPFLAARVTRKSAAQITTGPAGEAGKVGGGQRAGFARQGRGGDGQHVPPARCIAQRFHLAAGQADDFGEEGEGRTAGLAVGHHDADSLGPATTGRRAGSARSRVPVRGAVRPYPQLLCGASMVHRPRVKRWAHDEAAAMTADGCACLEVAT